MPARDSGVAAVGVESVAVAGGALGRDVDSREFHARADERPNDQARQIEGEPAAGVGNQASGGHGACNIGPYGVTTGMDARADGDQEGRRRRTLPPEALHRADADAQARPAPSAMKERATARVRGHDGDGSAVGDRDRDARIAGLDRHAVPLGSGLGWRHDRRAVHLSRHPRLIVGHAGRRAHPTPILAHGLRAIADGKAQVQRGERAIAHAAEPRGHREPGAAGKPAGFGPPKNGWVRGCLRVGTHGLSILDGRRVLAQGLCAVLLLAAGCARAPVASSGADARTRFLATYGRAEPASRGGGFLSARREGKRQGTLDLRWAYAADSVVVVGYAGPVRALDASLFGDSIYVALRPMDLGLAGIPPRGEGLGAVGLQFLTRPWDFGDAWIRDALDRASIESIEKGWRLAGTLSSDSGTHPYTLELDTKGDPRRLRIARAGREGTLIIVRYGPTRSYRGGRLPRWIEWEHGPSLLRLEIDEYARSSSGRLRRPPAADPEWEVMTLDDPRSRDLLRRFLGVGEEAVAP